MSSSTELIELLAAAKHLGKRYRELTGRPLGVTGEIAEYEAARILGLELAPVREAGFDAIRRQGDVVQRLQIKARCVMPGASLSQRVGGIDISKPWDAVLLVLLDENLEATAIFEAQRVDVEAALLAPGSRSRKERGALGDAKFKSISRRIWPPVSDGLVRQIATLALTTCPCCDAGTSFDKPRKCPRCNHVFRGKSWEGIDAHWRSNHEHEMPYGVFWDRLCAGHRS